MSPTLFDAMKTLHIVSFVAWMAGLFYLPRLFVYHTRLDRTSSSYAMFCEMERKLLLIIMRPAAIATWLFGLALSYNFVIAGAPPAWLIIKFCLVLSMTLFHWYCARHASRFERQIEVRTERFYRLFNEIPTILLLAIVYFVVFKPVLF